MSEPEVLMSYMIEDFRSKITVTVKVHAEGIVDLVVSGIDEADPSKMTMISLTPQGAETLKRALVLCETAFDLSKKKRK